MSIRAAFYAPLKGPDHPEPSGDRTMARLLWQALAMAGFGPELASGIRTREPRGDAERQEAIRAASLAEADRLIADFRARPPHARPQLWFTYHSYYKAPDWLGPRVAAALGIPYLLAEASRAGKRAGGPFGLGHAGAEAALAAASLIFVVTDHDREALVRPPTAPSRLVELPPFLDTGIWRPGGERQPGAPLRLLTVAMMREGDKLASYRILADALASLDPGALGPGWRLDIVGDGPARPEVRALFAPLAGRVAFLGRIDAPERLASLYRAADLFVWPAVNEAYGLVLLEAQACGCPVLAGRHGGVASAMRAGRTGRLAEPGRDAFAAALREMLAWPERLAPMGRAAARFVGEERSVEQAAATLKAAIAPLLARSEAA